MEEANDPEEHRRAQHHDGEHQGVDERQAGQPTQEQQQDRRRLDGDPGPEVSPVVWSEGQIMTL